VESCVNYVGVDLNMASRELLTYVSGITSAIANNIVAYRNEKGAFCDRNELLKVAKLGPKAFEQAAGFLRIRDGKNPLDNTAVHPERYQLVQTMSADLQLGLAEIAQASEKLKSLDLKRYVSDAVGLPTLRDILAELEKPGRDPRAQFTYASFKDNITEINDLTVGMELEGVVTNVANFGAFVDIGVHQDGLVHVSQMADKFVKDPKEIVQVGQVVKVKVLEVNAGLKRISLTMRSGPVGQGERSGEGRSAEKPSRDGGAKPAKVAKANAKPAATGNTQTSNNATLADLQAKFNRGKR
jgi:protein Tex